MEIRGKLVGMVPTCATCQGYGSQLLLIHSKKPYGPRVQTGQPEVVVAVSHIQRINYFTRWPIPLVVCWTGNREQKRKSGSPPPSPPLPPPPLPTLFVRRKSNQITGRIYMAWALRRSRSVSRPYKDSFGSSTRPMGVASQNSTLPRAITTFPASLPLSSSGDV